MENLRFCMFLKIRDQKNQKRQYCSYDSEEAMLRIIQKTMFFLVADLQKHTTNYVFLSLGDSLEEGGEDKSLPGTRKTRKTIVVSVV